MSVTLEHVTRTVDGIPTIRDVSLTLERGTLSVLLGPTLSGKTSIMRLLAGLDKPTTGRVLVEGKDVTGADVRQRSVAMVYQQFINYPSLTVYENIASPLRVQGRPREEIDRRVQEAAKLLRLEPYLKRTPLQLSGGQQQRTAIARALVKGADLVLLDEPLANLDYKLREELRAELPRIFEASGAIFVYATTEPSEALLLGGNTVCMWEGKVLQAGDTSKVYRQPDTLRVAQVFSDPPLNIVGIEKKNGSVQYAGGIQAPATGLYASLADGAYRVGFRAHQLEVANGIAGRHAFHATVTVTEITGSESFVHLNRDASNWVAVLQGVHEYEPGHVLDAVLDPDNVFVFDAADRLVAAPNERFQAKCVAVRVKKTRQKIKATEGDAAWPALTSSISRTPTAAMTRRLESFALKPVTMTWRQGGAYALLGPSGCGKTTLLNLISGIVTPSRGKILFDGADITPLSTQKRNIAQVFQFPVIYDTMTVGQNLAFPLKNRGVPKAEIDARVKEIADLLDLTPYLDRKATRLTADAKQKISLGRGLVRSDVAAVLFDEPLTVIDPELKWQLRSKLKALHRELDLTMIYVTHDQTEALTFADTVVVMHDGRVVQSGTPAELFDKPAHTFVGYFIGSPGMNIVPAAVSGHEARIDGHIIGLHRNYGVLPAGAKIEIGVRPEFVDVAAPASGLLSATIERIDDLGRVRFARVRVGDAKFAARVPPGFSVPDNDGRAACSIPRHVHVYADSRLVEGVA